MTNDKVVWIKVSDKLPNDRDWYLGTFKEKSTGWINPIPFICDYIGRKTSATTNDGWILAHCTDVDNRNPYYDDLECVAWTYLPEPFESMKQIMKSSECTGYQSKEVCETCDLPNKSCAHRDWAEIVAPELAKAIEDVIMNFLTHYKANEQIQNSATLKINENSNESKTTN